MPAIKAKPDLNVAELAKAKRLLEFSQDYILISIEQRCNPKYVEIKRVYILWGSRGYVPEGVKSARPARRLPTDVLILRMQSK